MEFYQACYGKPANNWQVLNVSPGTPPQMLSFFENIGNGCTPQNMGTDVLLDAQGAPVDLFELISGEHTLCLLKARYGERDSFGRPKMFAHGFMFPAQGSYADPNGILAVSDANFRFSKEETAAIPEGLALDAPLDIDAAMRRCGLTENTYKTLLACVYLVLSSAADLPLYVRCENAVDRIKAAIYCILSALPVSLRYQLSFSNANSFPYAKFKRVMFVDRVPAGAYYLDIETGETNLQRELQQIEESPEKFPSYYVFLKSSRREFAAYCRKIEEIRCQLLKPYDAELEDVDLAHELTNTLSDVNRKTDAELSRYLLELLIKLPLQNTAADDYICGLLTLLERRSIQPAETILKRLEQRVDHTASPDLVEVYKKIVLLALMSGGDSDTVEFLDQQYRKGMTVFSEWAGAVKATSGGDAIIRQFYKQLMESAASSERVNTIRTEALRFVPDDGTLSDAAAARICALSAAQLVRLDVTVSRVQPVFHELERALSEIPGAECSKAEAADRLKTDFWENFRFSSCRYTDAFIENMRYLHVEEGVSTAAWEKQSNVDCLVRIYDAVIGDRSAACTDERYIAVEKELRRFRQENTLSPADRETAVDLIRRLVVDAMAPREGRQHFCFWLELCTLSDGAANPVLQMMRWGLPVVCEADRFSAALYESHRMQAIGGDIRHWLNELLDKREEYGFDSDRIKTLKTLSKTVAEYQKDVEAAMKSRAKEERKRLSGAHSEPRKSSPDVPECSFEDDGRMFGETGHVSGKPGLFGKMFGGKKK